MDMIKSIIVNVASAIIIVGCTYLFAELVVLPNAKFEATPVTDTSTELTIENSGLMSASPVYTVTSTTPSVLGDFNVEVGKLFVDIKKTEDEKVKYIEVKDLPKSALIQIIINGDNIKIEEFKINSK